MRQTTQTTTQPLRQTMRLLGNCGGPLSIWTQNFHIVMTTAYSHPGGDGHQSHVAEHNCPRVFVLEEVDGRSMSRPPDRSLTHPSSHSDSQQAHGAPYARTNPESSCGLSKEERHSQFDNQILSYLSMFPHGIAHPLHPDRENVQCGSTGAGGSETCLGVCYPESQNG